MDRLTFMHWASVLGATPARRGSAAKECRLWRIDDVDDNTVRGEPFGIHWQGVVELPATSSPRFLERQSRIARAAADGLEREMIGVGPGDPADEGVAGGGGEREDVVA